MTAAVATRDPQSSLDVRESLSGKTTVGHTASALPVLGAEAEKLLWRRWRDNNDIAAACRLAAAYRWLLTTIASRYDGLGLSPDELMGEACLGLMRAICRFDSGGPRHFLPYAIWSVRTAIHDGILRECPQNPRVPKTVSEGCGEGFLQRQRRTSRLA